MAVYNYTFCFPFLSPPLPPFTNCHLLCTWKRNMIYKTAVHKEHGVRKYFMMDFKGLSHRGNEIFILKRP